MDFMGTIGLIVGIVSIAHGILQFIFKNPGAGFGLLGAGMMILSLVAKYQA